MATKPPNGIYTFSGRPGSTYKYENNQWFVSNSGTKNQYVPMQDPTGNRAKTLEAGLKSGKTQFTQILPTKSSYNQLTISTPTDNTRVANADFAAAAVANKPNVDRAVAAEKKAQYEFEKDKWEDYDKMSPTEKVVDRVDAFLTDPLGMVSRAVSGEQAYIPGMGQGLVDYENPNRNRYLQAVGYTPGKFEASDIQNMANPGYWGASIINNLNKGNYGTAATETALSFLPFLPKGSVGLARQGAGMIADDIARGYNNVATGNTFLTDLGVRAWKNPAANLDGAVSETMFNKILQSDNFTPAEKAMLKEYQFGNYSFVKPGTKQDAFNELIGKANLIFPEDAVITRAFTNPETELQAFTGAADDIKTISMQERPSAFSAGVSNKDKYYYDDTNRIVLSGKNLKKVEDNFIKQRYQPLEEGYYTNIPDEELTVGDYSKKPGDYGIGDTYYGTSRLTPDEVTAQAEAVYAKNNALYSDTSKTWLKPSDDPNFLTGKPKSNNPADGVYTAEESAEILKNQQNEYQEKLRLFTDPANKKEAIQNLISDARKGFANQKGPSDELELFGSGFDMKVVGKFPNKHGGFDYVVKPKNIKKLKEPDITSMFKSGLGNAGMIADDISKAGKYLTTQTPLRNTYKINPFALTAEKIAKKHPDDYFRAVKDPSAIDDAIESGVIRANTSLDPKFSSGKAKFKPEQVYFTKGVPEVGERYGKNIIQVPSDTPMKSQWLNQDFSKKLKKSGLFTNKDHLQGEYVIPNLGGDFITSDAATFYKQHWLQGYKKVPKQLPGSPNTFTRSGLGGMDMSMYTIKNPDYFTQLLGTYDKKALSATNRKFYKELIESVKKQEGLVTERQLNELRRLETGNFDFGRKGYNKGYAEGGKLNEWPPKKSPIYVTNLKDPRLKAYNDSLSLYNKTKDIQNPKYYTNGEPSWYNWKGTTKDAEKFMRKNNVDLDYEYYRTGKFPGKIQPIKTGYFGEGMAYPIYKKPIQPYIYKKPELEVIPTFLPPTNVEDWFELPAIVGEENKSEFKIPDTFFEPSPIANEVPTIVPEFVNTRRYDSNLNKWIQNPMAIQDSTEAQYDKQRWEWAKKNIENPANISYKFADGGILDRIRKRLNTKEEEYNSSKDLSLLNKYNSEVKQIQDLEESDPRRVEYEKANSQFVLDKAKYDEALKSYEDQLLLFNEYNNLDPKAKLQISPEEFIQIKKDNKNIEEYLTPSKFYTPYSKNYSGIGNAQDFKKIIPDYDQEIFNARRLLNNPDYYMDMSGSATDEQISNIINETREKYKNLYPNTNTVGFLRELDVTAEPFFRGKDRKYTVPKTPEVENYTNYKTFQKIFPNINDSYYEGRVAGASNTYSSGYGYDRIELENNPKLAISTYSDSAGRVIPYYKPEFVSYGASNMFSPYPEFSQPNELSPAPVEPSLTYEERVYPYAPAKVYNSQTNTWENRVAPAGSLQDKYTREREAWRLRNGNNPSSHLPIGQAPGGTFADGGPLNDKTNHGKILDSVYASAIGDYYANGGMLKRADGSYSRRGLWDNIRAAAARNKAQGKPGKAPTKEMLEQAKVSSKANGGFVAGRQMYQPLDIRESYGGFLYGNGGQFPTTFSLPEDSFKQGGNNLHDSVYASSMAQYPAVYGMGGSILSMSNTPELSGEGKDLSVPENAYIYSAGGSIKKFKK